jgi:APA family basic amino acid/polyamine antiporter
MDSNVTDDDRRANPDSLLVRGLGIRQLTATIFNHTVGSGIFVLPAFAVAQLGTAAPLAYLVCALVMLLGQSLARLAGLTHPAWPGAIVLALVVMLAAVNIRGLAWGARVVEIFTAAKLVPLLFFVLAGAFFISPPNLHWTTVPTAAQVATTTGTLIFAFTGIETALMPSGEVRDPTRTVPRAAMLALGAATLLYLSVQAVALGILGPALASDTVAPLATAAGRFAGRTGSAVLLAGASISMFGWLTGSILAGPRALFALARDGFLPRRLAAVHSRHHTPHLAIMAYAALAIGTSLTGTFEQLAVLSNLAGLGVYFLGAIAVWQLRRRNVRSDRDPFLMPGGPTVPILACIAIAWIVTQTVTTREVIALGGVLGLSLAVYLAKRDRRPA